MKGDCLSMKMKTIFLGTVVSVVMTLACVGVLSFFAVNGSVGEMKPVVVIGALAFSIFVGIRTAVGRDRGKWIYQVLGIALIFLMLIVLCGLLFFEGNMVASRVTLLGVIAGALAGAMFGRGKNKKHTKRK